MTDTLNQLSQKIFPGELEQLCVELACRAGLSKAHAQITAEVLVMTDTWGVHTHGVKQLRGLMKNLRQGRLDPDAEPVLASSGPSWGLVDAHNAMPIVASKMGMQIAVDKARQTGIAFVGVQHSGHFGAAGYYAHMAARQDMIGLAMCNTEPFMTVPGARGRVLGTNPLSYAVPAGRFPPIVLDIATSAVAVSKIFAARTLGKQIPDNWLVDVQGVPTTDPNQLDAGALLPMAGYKGYGLALLVETLSAALTGSAMLSAVQSWVLDLPGPPDQGHAFVAVDPGVFMPLTAFKQRIDIMIDEIKAARLAPGSERIYMPGEMEWEKRGSALRSGMLLPEDVATSLRGLADDINY